MGFLPNMHLLYSANFCGKGVRDPEGVEARRRGLERFLRRVASHPVLGSAKLLYTFLTAKDDKVGLPTEIKRLVNDLSCSLCFVG